jgi:hypothetical protein
MPQHKGNPALPGGAQDSLAESDAVQNNVVGPNNQGIVGRRFGHWTIVQADATGKRCHARCVCGRVRYLGFEMLRRGYIDRCGCRPPTIQDREIFRIERERAAARRGGRS